MKNAGERLVELLETYGVELIFGIPGAHNLELYRGLAASPIRHVLARHEQGAAFAADGYARVTGKPGVCFLITGPGVANASAAIGQAYSDSVPLLVISSACDRGTLGKGRGFLHECRDQTLLTAGVTAWSVMAQTAADIPLAIAKAFAGFAQERPRPVHLSIPMDVLKECVPEPWVAAPTPEKHTAGPQAIAAAAHLMMASIRPLIIIGGGAVGAASEVRELAERSGALVASTVAGKGILPADHPHFSGSFLCLPQGWALAEAADLVIAVGTELAETDFWRTRLPIGAPIIRIDIDPAKIADSYPAAVGLIGDAAPTLRVLLAEIETQKLPAPASQSRAAWSPPFTEAQLRAHLAPLQQAHQRVWQAVAAAVSAETVITADMTQLGYSGNYLMPRSRPWQWLHPTGFGTLGYALPAAIGASLGSGQPVLCVIGDAGLLFTLSELASAVEELRSPLIVLLWNNSALGEIRDNMLEAEISPVGVIARNPDFIALARAFGCVGVAPTSCAGLQEALAQAIIHPGVTLIEMTPEAVN